MVLGVGQHLGVRLDNATELSLPIAVEHDPVDVVFGRWSARVPAVDARRVEPNVPRRARVVVGVKQSFDGALPQELARDSRGDTVRRHVSQHLVF